MFQNVIFIRMELVLKVMIDKLYSLKLFNVESVDYLTESFFKCCILYLKALN